MKKLSGYDVFDYCMTAVAFIIGAAIGVALWGATLLLLTEAPWGSSNGSDLLVFLIPLIAIVVPFFNWLIWRGKGLSALWLVALAPILGVLSTVTVALLSEKLFSSSNYALLSLAIHAPIAYFMFRGLGKKPQEKPDQT